MAHIIGTAGNDILYGTPGEDDLIEGLGGDDFLDRAGLLGRVATTHCAEVKGTTFLRLGIQQAAVSWREGQATMR